MEKIILNMNSNKFTIRDRDSVLKEIIYMDTVYPREK